MRKYRKREHIENYLKTSFMGDPLFKDVYLEHNSLPEIDFRNIDTKIEFLNKEVEFPLMINAMTGGTEFSEDLNRELSLIAKRFKLPMAVGSQTITFEDEDAHKSFKVVREILSEGIVISNVNGFCSLDNAKKAIDLLEADGLQIHINPAQEIAMEEGDRDFTGILKNVEKIVKSIDVPVIIKEVGFGISKNVAESLYNIGVRNIDVSGFGGTNFFEVENLRCPDIDLSDLYDWGIPTALSLIDVKSLNKKDLYVIASGGIKSSLDLAKSIALGANITGISGELLSYLVHGGCEYAKEYIENLIYKTKVIMLLTGCNNINELREVNYRLTGRLKELVK